MRTYSKLSAKQVMFCKFYAGIDSETYGKKNASALLAGYSENSSVEMATRLTTDNPLSMKRIEKIYELNAKKHKGRLLSHLEYQRRGAVKDRKWDAANTAVKLQAQIFGFLASDSFAGHIDKEQAKLTERQVQEAKEFARWRLAQDIKEGTEIIKDSLGEQ